VVGGGVGGGGWVLGGGGGGWGDFWVGGGEGWGGGGWAVGSFSWGGLKNARRHDPGQLREGCIKRGEITRA